MSYACLPAWPCLACLRNPAFSAVDCMRLQSALGRLGPDGVPSYTTDPFVGSLPATVRSVLTSSQGLDPGKARNQAHTMCSRYENRRPLSHGPRGAVAMWAMAPSSHQNCDLP